ncbi:MAG: oxidoreductase [Clostridia bacterium]|nr:oxidoreductase [Clostridia bacterium]
MKQTSAFISTYTSDTMGVCSALFELGGMSIMHDASGCNSTYNTHDEPRWYDTDSMVFLSGLSETEAIMGDDEKLIRDTVDAANALHPRFIALAGSPIPMVVGTDLSAIAAVIEKRTGIPSFGIAANGMRSYLMGAGEAFAALAKRFVNADAQKTDTLSANILGLTPLDFSVNGSAEDIKTFLEANGIRVVSAWAMGATLEELAGAAAAHVNLVVSYAGMATAKYLQKTYGIPYVTGVPFGENFSGNLLAHIKTAARQQTVIHAFTDRVGGDHADYTIIGESITCGSLAAAISAQTGKTARVLCPLETEAPLLTAADAQCPDETDLVSLLRAEDTVIADPLYRPVCPAGARFLPLPSEGFSGRIFRREIPNLIGKKITLL